VKTSDLRIALFTGNYNYVRDGANQALNRLVGYLLRQGAAVRVYSPTVDEPAFRRPGIWSACPRSRFPARSEYRFPMGFRPACGAIWPPSRPTWSTSPRPTVVATAR
jgi:phosphatidylinositol alpha 1,6-mannosyltransferase